MVPKLQNFPSEAGKNANFLKRCVSVGQVIRVRGPVGLKWTQVNPFDFYMIRIDLLRKLSEKWNFSLPIEVKPEPKEVKAKPQKKINLDLLDTPSISKLGLKTHMRHNGRL